MLDVLILQHELLFSYVVNVWADVSIESSYNVTHGLRFSTEINLFSQILLKIVFLLDFVFSVSSSYF